MWLSPLYDVQAPKVQASKEAKALAASNSSKGKKKVLPVSSSSPSTASSGLQEGQELTGSVLAQKWSKGKMKEKVNNQVLFDKVSQRWSPCSLSMIRLRLVSSRPQYPCVIAAHL